MRNRKRIGLIMAQPEELYQTQLLSGFLKRAFELDYDCLIFSISIKNDATPEICVGESNIINLINFNKLDGVAILPDTIKITEVLDRIVKMVGENFSGPVLYIDLKSDRFPYVLTDDSPAVEAVCDHLIKRHGCRTIDFMGGVPGHEHSVKRFEGYKRALEKNGIELDMRRVHDGDFWYFRGMPVAEEIINSGLPFPDAVVCASDTMAISLCDAFIEKGYRIPEDIRIMGYDSISEGIDHVPSISSAKMPSADTGRNAAEFFRCAFEGDAYKPLKSDIELVTSETCGCEDNLRARMEQNGPYSDQNYKSMFYSSNNNMMSEIISQDDMLGLIKEIDWYTCQIKPFSQFFLCLCDNWAQFDLENINDYRRVGYEDKIHLMLRRSGEDIDVNEIIGDIEFDKEVMLPDIEEDREYPAAYYFASVCFFDRCFGYTVLKFENLVGTPNIDYRGWMKNICNGLECMRRNLHIKSMYSKLRIEALTDSLTGLYNRYAFNKYVEEITKEVGVGRSGKNMLFIMADLNYLKTINDTFGHLAGDTALRAAGQALLSVCGENERCYRFGGDEFMIIGSGEYSKDKIDSLISGIERFLDDYNASANNPFNVMISMGVVYTKITDESQIDKFIRAADEIMYSNKQASKKLSANPFRMDC